ncbi:DUF397 domain-containing protein [Actinomadura chibensis]|uniref:DUF397 domain-containing protein n=1 Tax=Actinomadura chibensis TaxID=392828 RepID=A0A5D0NZQ7_9ACTN|nr:DUF397 domain-containing protein [Actinomadura chibensis]TYB49634.1 DUF397 domain-containing protein [Actinomadura chibensis]
MIQWRKSSHSQGDGGACVEVSTGTVNRLVRDSKDPEGPRLALGVDAWAVLVQQIKAGALDL